MNDIGGVPVVTGLSTTAGQNNQSHEISTDALHGLFNIGPRNNSVSTYDNSSENQTVTIYSTSGAQDLCYDILGSTDQSINNTFQTVGPVITPAEESCQMLNATDPISTRK